MSLMDQFIPFTLIDIWTTCPLNTSDAVSLPMLKAVSGCICLPSIVVMIFLERSSLGVCMIPSHEPDDMIWRPCVGISALIVFELLFR